MYKVFIKSAVALFSVLGSIHGFAQADLLLLRNDGSAATWFMHREDQLFGTVLNPSNVGDLGWQIVGAGKINADTKTDILFQHTNGD